MKTVKVLFTGPECSGKTTLAMWAAKKWNGTYVPEYARLYLQSQQGYQLDDLIYIAHQQLKLEHMASRKGGYIFHDTSLLVIHIWMLEKFGTSLWDKGFAPQHLDSFDHILLTKPDIPWSADELRENPEDRYRLFEIYERYLSSNDLRYTTISGSTDHRKQALAKLV